MRTLSRSALCILAVCQLAAAGELSGVIMPDTIMVDGTTLVLNGMGQRKKLWVEVYVGGLYLPSKTADATQILDAGSPWRLVMHFLHKKVDKSKLDGAWMEGFGKNAPDVLEAHPQEVERFLACFPDMLKGQEVVLTFFPDTGLEVDVAGEVKDVFIPVAFARGVLSIWLGPQPPSDDLKRGLLGTLKS